jgi:hypothetical protein
LADLLGGGSGEVVELRGSEKAWIKQRRRLFRKKQATASEKK